MKAEIVSIGTELLLGQIVDTNAAYIASHLADMGIGVYHKAVVGDNEERIIETLGTALGRADIVLTTGGLGPTVDDLTFDCIAKAAGTHLVRNPQVEEDIKAFFLRLNRPMAKNNLKQALVPEGADIIRNGVGSAPGIIFETVSGSTIIAMPGVPSEMKWMMEQAVMPYLKGRTDAEGGAVLVSRVLKIFGIGESMVEDMVRDILDAQTNPTIAPLASAQEVKLRITAKAGNTSEAMELIAPVEALLRSRLGNAVFGIDDEGMETVLGKLLVDRGWMITTAESCTGGLIAKRLTDTPGSSAYVDRAYVTYTNEAKSELLGVAEDLLNAKGAVSREVAAAMADGALKASRAQLSLSVTGIAGPGGGTPDKPVGLVYVGLGSHEGVWVRECHFIGDRETIRMRTSQTALDMARRYLLGSLGDGGEVVRVR